MCHIHISSDIFFINFQLALDPPRRVWGGVCLGDMHWCGRNTTLEDTCVYGPGGDSLTDAADELADGNENVPRKTDADMEPVRVYGGCELG